MTNLVLLSGRLLMAASFVPGAIERLSNISGFAAVLAQKGVPYAQGLAAFSAVAGSLGPLALAIGIAPRFTAAVLVGVTVVNAGALLPGPLRLVDRSLLAANLAVISGLLFYAIIGPGAWSVPALWQRGRAAPRSSKAPAKKAAARAPRPKPVVAREAMSEA